MARIVIGVLLLPIVAAHAQQRASDVGRGPQPAPNPISWEFELKYLDLRRITVQLAGSESPEDFWYMVYTVTNPGTTTQRFFPSFQLVTDELAVIDADVGISPIVFDAIRERHRATHPYLVHPTQAIGDLKSGDDNARESVAIWRGANLDVNAFTIFVAGLSGEARLIPNPAYDPDAPETVMTSGGGGTREREVIVNPKHFTLRKSLAIEYTLAGSPHARQHAEPQRARVRWVMR